MVHRIWGIRPAVEGMKSPILMRVRAEMPLGKARGIQPIFWRSDPGGIEFLYLNKDIWPWAPSGYEAR